MPLCQYVISPANSGSDFTVPISERANIKVVSIQYVDTNAGNHHHVVQLRSDTLIFSSSSTPYLTFLISAGIHSQTNLSFDQGKNEFSINRCNLNGRMKLEVIDADTGLQPDHFGHMILTLDIETIGIGF